MLNYETLENSCAYLLLANCKAFIDPTMDGRFTIAYNKNEDILVEFLENSAKEPIFFIMRDKQKKVKTKAIAQYGLGEWVKARQTGNFERASKHLTDSINGITRVVVGEEEMDLIMDGLEHVFSDFEEFDDIADGTFKVVLKVAMQRLRTDLLSKGLYEGPA